MTVSLTGLTAGTWTIDPTHSTIGFTVRHLVVSKVRGTFADFSGAVTVADGTSPTVTAAISVASFSTNNAGRDEHIRSGDFLDIAEFPEITFTSTGISGGGESFTLTGDLTLHGVTKSVDLAVEFNGVNPGMGHGPVAGFEAATTINRKDFGISIDMPLEGGGAVVGDKIVVTLEIELIKSA